MVDGPEGNNRVTLAVIGEKLDTLLKRLEELCRDIADHETRIRALERNEALEKRIREVEDRSKINEQRIGLFAGLQATFTAIAATVAGWLGTR